MESINKTRGHGSSLSTRPQRLPQKVSVPAEFLNQEETSGVQVWPLLRKYLPLGIVLVLAGTAAGFCMVLFETPIYKARILMEVQPLSSAVTQNGMDPFAALFSMDSTNVQTEVRLLDSGPFRGLVLHEMEAMTPPPAPPVTDIFGKLRNTLRPAATRNAISQQNALEMAANTFSVSIVNETRLIELSCESPHPAITSGFLNNIAEAFVADAVRNRGVATEKTNAWLSSHIDETKAKLQDADSRLRTFVMQSGNVFASDATVDDVKLKTMQSQLAGAEVDRLAKQAAYETAVRSSSPENLPQVVIDPVAGTLRGQIAELERQKSALLVTLTRKNPKVLALEDQQRELESALDRATKNVLGRIENEYRAATDHEKLLLKAYAQESGQVTALASKAAQYSALRREVDELQKRYDSLLQELSRTQVAESAPVIPLRLVQPSEPPALPYKPQPKTQVMLGVIGGLAATLGFAFVREKMNRSVGSPEALQSLIRVPQLGVIPEVNRLPKPTGSGIAPLLGAVSRPLLLQRPPGADQADMDSGHVARAAWEDGSVILADSFRSTLASITRHLGGSGESRIILVTSSTPGAGKTTVVSNLGIALSEAGRRAVIVDADFRRPCLSRVFGCTSPISFPDILLDDKPIADYREEELTAATSFPALRLLPSRHSAGRVASLIYSPRLSLVLERLVREFDVVLVDVPPILFPADARVIAEHSHGVVLVIRAEHCERDGICAAVKCLHEDGVPILGTVLNGWVPSGSHSGMRYYNYYYSEKGSFAG